MLPFLLFFFSSVLFLSPSSFGHKFTERVGHGGIGGTENSPVFSQWLDCVWQVLTQHPSRFEFHQGLLLALRHSLHSGKYGDWMGNCEAERNAFVAAASSASSSSSAAPGAGAGAGPAHSGSSANGGGGGGSSWRLRDKTPSIFTQLWSYRAAFLNPGYEHAPGGTPFLDAQSPHARAHPLQVDLARLAFWGEYYMGTAAPATKFSAGGVLAAASARTASGPTKPLAQAQVAAPAAATTTVTATAAEVESQLEAERAAAKAAQTRALAEQKEAYESRLAAQSRALDEALAALSALKAAQTASAVSVPLGAGGADGDHPPPPPPFRPSMLEQEPRAAHPPPAIVATVAAAGDFAPAPSSPLDGADGEADAGADADDDAAPTELDDAADLDVDGLDLDATRPRALGRTSTMLRPRHGRADAVTGAQASASPRSFPAATSTAAARALSPVHAAGSPPAASTSLTAAASPASSSSAGAMGVKLRKEGPALPAKLRAVPPPPPPEENTDERRDSEFDPPPPPPPVPDDRSSSRSSLPPPPPPPPLPSSPPSMALLRPAPIALVLARAAAEPAAEPEANAGSSPARAL